MTGIDPKRQGTDAEAASSGIDGESIDEPTLDLIRSLRSRLAELQRSSEAEQSDLASECAALLDRIEQELR